MNEATNCPQCGTRLPVGAAFGACPACLLRRAEGGGVSSEYSAEPWSAAGPGHGPSGEATRERGPRRAAAPSLAELAPHFPQFEILELIGQGGMGVVYKARQKNLDRIVALKILAPGDADAAGFSERFQREARALARLDHPHIVGVYESGQAGPYFYLALEYVDGVNLRQAMRSGSIQPRHALELVAQICDALQFAHQARIVHRDIKPENVMIDREGRVKVTDFGLAKLIHPLAAEEPLTATHQVMGTPRYMAPEQLEGARDVDHRADIYSLGVVFYELLTGELPLGRFPPPSRKVHVDVRLDEIVLRTLEKAPELRYQHAGELRTDVVSMASGKLAPSTHVGGYEYRSRAAIFGVPLVHVAMGRDPNTNKPRVARGVIAIGSRAVGLVAVGGMACGGIAFGGVAVGGLCFGGMTAGIIVFGGLTLGLVAAGGVATGLLALGGIATGYVAIGGLAIGVYPLGGARFAFGPGHANPFQGSSDLLASWEGLGFSRAPTWFGLLCLLLGIGVASTLSVVLAAAAVGRSGKS